MSVTTRAIPTGPASRPGGSGDRGREFLRATLTVACGPALAGYAVVTAVLAVLGWAASGAEPSTSGTLTAAGAAWLAVHQVPLTITGDPLGVLPLLPTALLVLLIARTARRAAAGAAPVDAVRLLGIVAGVHATVGTVLAVTISAGPSPVVEVAPLGAAAGCGLVAAAAAAAGLAGPCGWIRLAVSRAPGWAGHALPAAVLGLAVLLSGGLAAVLWGLIVSAGATHDAFGAWGPDWGSGLGLTLLSVGYLPNAVVGAVSWLAGPGLSIGALSVTPLGVLPGPVPAVPLLAALPEGPAAAWWTVAFVVPLLAGLAVGRRCRGAADPPRAVAGAAGAMALGCFVLALLAGGSLGGGPFDPVQVPAATFALAVAGWTALPGAAVVWFAGSPEVASAPAEEPAADVTESEATESEATESDATESEATDDAEEAEESAPDRAAAEDHA